MATDYCVTSDIEANLKGTSFSASTTPSDTELDRFIDEESRVIDAHLRGRYDLPITDATALEFLRKISVDLVVYRVSKLLMPREQKTLPDGRTIQDVSHSSAYREAMRMLKSLMDGKLSLPGVSVKGLSFIQSYQEESDTDKNFDVEKQQW